MTHRFKTLSIFLKIKVEMYFEQMTLWRFSLTVYIDLRAVKYSQKCHQCCVTSRGATPELCSNLQEKFTKHGCRRFLCFRLFLPSSSFMLPLSPGPPALLEYTLCFYLGGVYLNKLGAQTTSQQLHRNFITKIQSKKHQQIRSISDGLKACTWLSGSAKRQPGLVYQVEGTET